MSFGKKFLYEITWETMTIIYTDFIVAKNVEKALKKFYKDHKDLTPSICGISVHNMI